MKLSLLLCALQLVALAEGKLGVHCGHMSETTLKPWVRGDPDDPIHLAALCGNPHCYHALFSYLPEPLWKTIYSSLNVNAWHLGQALYFGEPYFQGKKFIPDTYKWYRSMAHEQKEVCWFGDIDSNWARHHISAAGVLSNLLIRPDSLSQVMPRRFGELPQGSLQINETICFDRNNTQYQWLGAQARWIVTDESVTAEGKFWTYEDFLDDFSKWPGTMGLALLGMMRKSYECAPGTVCYLKMMQGQPFLPDSWRAFLHQLKVAVNSNLEICFVLDNKVPEDRKLGKVYYFVPGVKEDEGRLVD